MRGARSDFSIWDEDEIVGPDVNDRNTLLTLAKMTSNAYFNGPSEKGWYDLGQEWNNVCIVPFILLSCLISTLELSIRLGA